MDVATATSLQPDVIMIDRYEVEARELDKKIAMQASKLSTGAGTGSSDLILVAAIISFCSAIPTSHGAVQYNYNKIILILWKDGRRTRYSVSSIQHI